MHEIVVELDVGRIVNKPVLTSLRGPRALEFKSVDFDVLGSVGPDGSVVAVLAGGDGTGGDIVLGEINVCLRTEARGVDMCSVLTLPNNWCSPGSTAGSGLDTFVAVPLIAG